MKKLLLIALCQFSFILLFAQKDGDEAVITDQKPTSCSFSDYYIFPKNLAWTMAFTHEDGWLGPFFAKHSDFDKLNGENLKRIRKAEEAAEAKKKGYS